MIDIALTVDKLLPAAEYSGSVTANTEAAWDAVSWTDPRRAKPAWAELEAAMPDPLEQTRLAKIAEINAGYDSVMGYIQSGYPDKEVLSWERQAVQARELKADPDADAMFVRTLAAVKEVPVQEMADRIINNAENWEPIAAMLTAQRQLMEEAAWGAESVEEVALIRVSYTA